MTSTDSVSFRSRPWIRSWTLRVKDASCGRSIRNLAQGNGSTRGGLYLNGYFRSGCLCIRAATHRLVGLSGSLITIPRTWEQVAAYLDNVIVFDPDPSANVKTSRAFFERLRKNNLELSPSKAQLGAIDVSFLDHSISPAGARPNEEKLSALTLMSMSRDPKQLCSFLGGLSCCRKFLREMSKRIRPITSVLKKGVIFFHHADHGSHRA